MTGVLIVLEAGPDVEKPHEDLGKPVQGGPPLLLRPFRIGELNLLVAAEAYRDVHRIAPSSLMVFGATGVSRVPVFLNRRQKRTADVTDLKLPPPRTRLSDEEKRVYGADLKRQYEGGATSIRALAGEHGRSYGFIRDVLVKAGARLYPPGPRATKGLTRRQSQVLRLLAVGGTPKLIAVELGIRVNVVHTHLWQVRRRTCMSGGSSTHPAVVEAAYEAGLLPLPVRLPDRVSLTGRQRKLIGLLAMGLTVDRIASRLGCRPGEALAELKALERALGATSPAHVITRVRQYGLVTSSEDYTAWVEGVW